VDCSDFLGTALFLNLYAFLLSASPGGSDRGPAALAVPCCPCVTLTTQSARLRQGVPRLKPRFFLQQRRLAREYRYLPWS